jgi:hypothetical protein
LALFTFHRAIFLIDGRKYFDGATTREVLYGFVSAFKLDMSTVGYFVLPTLLLILFTVFSNKAIFNTIIRYLHLFITLIYSGLSVSEILLYREWQAKIGYDSLRHFANVSEVIKTPSISMALFL